MTKPSIEEKKKLNKYGCRPSEDVFLKHDSPLITFGMCEDSPEIKDFVEVIKTQSRQEVIEDVYHLIDCEMDCIKDGNTLTPSEQDKCLSVCKNIKKRLPPIIKR